METADSVRANRLLEGLLYGRLSGVELYQEALDIDPVFVFFVFRLVRELANSGGVDERSVLQRLLELNETYPEITKKARNGEQDPVTEWFLDSYQLRDYMRDPSQLFSMIEEKLES